jgi:hypothetical protein
MNRVVVDSSGRSLRRNGSVRTAKSKKFDLSAISVNAMRSIVLLPGSRGDVRHYAAAVCGSGAGQLGPSERICLIFEKCASFSVVDLPGPISFQVCRCKHGTGTLHETRTCLTLKQVRACPNSSAVSRLTFFELKQNRREAAIRRLQCPM